MTGFEATRLAIPVWEDRVSPVFDAARTLLVVDLDRGRVHRRWYERVEGEALRPRVDRLERLGVKVLICGAVSGQLASLIEQSGIRLVPFIAGRCEEVLAAFARGDPPSADFLMPGCRRLRGSGGGRGAGAWGCRRGGRGRGRGTGWGKS